MRTPFFIFLKRTLFLLFFAFFISCGSKKNIVYYQNSDSRGTTQNEPSYEITIQPDDVLLIIVSAEDPEIARPFNLTTVAISNSGNVDAAMGQQVIQTYLVDKMGNIEFPVLGTLQVGGLTRTQIVALLKEKIGVYVKNPMINLRITNFKISLQGEVNQPGTYPIASERVTLIEALSLAKDLTIYGKRDNILVIRENKGIKSFHRVDLTQTDFMSSPFYYLTQNDVVYVEPNNTKINAAVVGPNTSVIISAISILVSLSVLIFR